MRAEMEKVAGGLEAAEERINAFFREEVRWEKSQMRTLVIRDAGARAIARGESHWLITLAALSGARTGADERARV